MKTFMCAVLALSMVAVAFAAVVKSDPIAKQERLGTALVVTYASGKVTTNSLFLAMAPEVKNEIDKIETADMMSKTLTAVISDTRRNIPETAALPDSQVALLYLSQMQKSSSELEPIAGTNTLEHLIGAGMRMDLNTEGKQ